MAAQQTITVDIPYVKRNEDGNIPNHAQMFSHDAEFLDVKPAEVHNARATDQEFSIAATGFQYAQLHPPPDIDYLDDEQVRRIYFPQLEKLLKEQYVVTQSSNYTPLDVLRLQPSSNSDTVSRQNRLGASQVKAFHHVVRNVTYKDGMVYTRKHRCPARRPHVDVTSKFAPTLMSWDCPDMHADVHANGKHWQMVNAWRPLKTVRKNPVTVAETGSMAWEDYLVVPQPEVGPGVEGYWLQRPQDAERQHKWWYMADQTPEDVLLFLQHDSEGAQVVAHTSFSLPGPAPAEPRESIEVRLFVVY
ncbi:Gibberellin cluster GA4 desaturase [Colletotrichum sidae]|uniref:Gibberellin cluster GA4 desaturase n=1 Tax=Colletotrichum sidae TaxID=1347389 RepID=A0A4R8T6E5_9PEZI|nr:Gibberellin cluster GA4 desaturase [Colletotrichum sidae]